MITRQEIIVESNIRYYRKKLGYTQEELARLIGVTKNAISNYENGQMLPRLDVAFSLVFLFDCSFYELFSLKCNTGADIVIFENMDIQDESI